MPVLDDAILAAVEGAERLVPWAEPNICALSAAGAARRALVAVSVVPGTGDRLPCQTRALKAAVLCRVLS